MTEPEEDPRSLTIVMGKWIAVQRSALYLSDKMVNALTKISKKVIKELSVTATQTEIISAVIAEVNAGKSIMYKQLATHLQGVANPVAIAANKTMSGVVKNPGKPPKYSIAKVKSLLANSVMPATNSTVKDLFDSTFDNMTRQISNAVRVAYADGATVSSLKTQVDAIIDQASRRLQMVSTSATNIVSNDANNAAFKLAGADRLIWVSTLDHRTSNFCKLADGKVFPVMKGPRPPAHPNCRSTVLPLKPGENAKQKMREWGPRPAVEAKSVDALKEKGIKTKKYGGKPGGKMRNPGRGDNTPLEGVTTKHLTYEQWLKDQPALYQDAILGQKAAIEFREKGATLNSVLSKRSSSINLDSLKEALQ